MVQDLGGTPPRSAFPLTLCQGDCDSDRDCKGDLVCLQRGRDDPIPGCMGIVETFPNPTENLINLVAQHDVIKAVELFGIDGKSIPLPYNSASNQIDVSALPAGTYFVRVACDQSVKTFKFLKIE